METVRRLCVVVLLTVTCCIATTRPETTLTCDLEDFAQRLNCNGGVIAVRNVTASHREAESCVGGVPPRRLDTPLCSSTSILNVVKTRCDGRSSCSVPMDSCHVAPPCSSRCVWMKTTFTCELGEIHQVCQKKKASLFCGSRVIRVLMANYGRTSTKVCEYGAPRRQPPSTSCRLAEALQLMADRCDGKHKCSIRASNLVFSNPCPGTRKYLEYSYTCVHPGS